ncbi:hypothetical protein EV44_g3310 [Erysiphe necator]|uniref:Uncharacterized protein n=1 Tax=Uncinula necator TaxID=52586 RepID=A0A0B1NX00_UNCNE|nr:hypothetical protein EV44_g3310 [Erysiphe necator]
MKSALVPSLRKGVAYRSNVSMTSYDLFVREVQDLANELESLPDFRLARGSEKEVYVHEILGYQQQISTPTSSTNVPIPPISFPPSSVPSPTPYPNIDHDGDVRMGDINTLQTQMQSLVAAISNLNIHNNPNNRKTEHRPYPPECSQAERNRRVTNGCCERCGKSPSHRWSDCSFRNFKNNPTSRGQGRSRSAYLNSASSIVPDDIFQATGALNSGNGQPLN